MQRESREHGPQPSVPNFPPPAPYLSTPPPRPFPPRQNAFPPNSVPPPHLNFLPSSQYPNPQHSGPSKSNHEHFHHFVPNASFPESDGIPAPPNFMPPPNYPPPVNHGLPPVPPHNSAPPLPMASAGRLPAPFSFGGPPPELPGHGPPLHILPPRVMTPSPSSSVAQSNSGDGYSRTGSNFRSDNFLNTSFSVPPPLPNPMPQGVGAHPAPVPSFHPTMGPLSAQHPRPPPMQDFPPYSPAAETPPAVAAEAGDEDDVQRRWDQDWIKGWLNRLHLPVKSDKQRRSDLKICDAQAAMRQAMSLMAKLKAGRTALQEALTSEDIAWCREKEQVEAVKRELDSVMEGFMDKDAVESLKRKITLRKAKRARLRRKRKREWEEEQLQQQERAETDARIDQWLADIFQKDQEKKQEAEMKKAADSTLSEVRRKLTESARALELLALVQKLRKIRKDAGERHGKMVPSAYIHEKEFEEKIAKLREFIESQRTVYEAEEKTLKVMLEMEQEETKEKEREQQRLQDTRKAAHHHRVQLERIFGKTEELDPDDEMFPFRQYYEQAQHSLEAFIHIRREWDTFLVPPGTPGSSSIPDCWVLPPDPSSKTWEKCLQE